MKEKIEGKVYVVTEKTHKNRRVKAYKPVMTPEENKRRSEYVTQRCAQILKIHG